MSATDRKQYFIDCVKYGCLICVIYIYIELAFYLSDAVYNENGPNLHDALERYGHVSTSMLYAFSAAIYLAIPVSVCNLIGIVRFNPFAMKSLHVTISKQTPFMCFRVVTRGLYPKLVQSVTEKNLEMCQKFGIKNFKFEIVTDNALHFKPLHHVREIVVPSEYRSPNGTLFKARALHYCLTDHVNILSNDDWIIHLDEETLLTESVLRGIVDFIIQPSAQIGQGVITYGGGEIENWLTTLMDGVRTAVDYGLFRFSLQLINRPIFGLKGSFIVVKMAVEASIGFDFGPRESIAEDLRFALTAWDRGYRFDFVEGVMQEKSTFTLSDFVKQRKRWVIGHYHVIWNTSLPVYCKFAVMPMHIGSLLLWMNVLNTILAFITPVPIMKWQCTLFFMMSTNFLFLFVFGNFMSISSRRHYFFTKICICLVSQMLLPVLGIVEAYAALLGYYHRNNLTFEIVQKETSTTSGKIDSDHIDV